MHTLRVPEPAAATCNLYCVSTLAIRTPLLHLGPLAATLSHMLLSNIPNEGKDRLSYKHYVRLQYMIYTIYRLHTYNFHVSNICLIRVLHIHRIDHIRCQSTSLPWCYLDYSPDNAYSHTHLHRIRFSAKRKKSFKQMHMSRSRISFCVRTYVSRIW